MSQIFVKIFSNKLDRCAIDALNAIHYKLYDFFAFELQIIRKKMHLYFLVNFTKAPFIPKRPHMLKNGDNRSNGY